jgi:D-alanyl-D-alanine carboxypeptidase (penicillin-binding protein 5/6)
MSRTILLVTAASLLAATAAPAAAPQFDTPAKTAFLTDLNSGAILYAKNPDMRMPPASMAKMMTTEVAFELIDRGQLPLNKMCTVRPETWQKWHGPQAGSTMFLSPGEQVSVENLLKGIVTLSGNDASVVLAECIAGTEQAFTDQMNELAKKLGLTNSHFGTANGWPDNGVTYVTARDLATLAKATIQHHPKLYKEFYSLPSFTWGKTLGSGQAITQDNRNPILGHVPGADGLKTGHTEEGGYGEVGSVQRNGRRIILVLNGLNSIKQRAEESQKLAEWAFREFDDYHVYKAGEVLGEVPVTDGTTLTVPMMTEKAVDLTLQRIAHNDMKTNVTHLESVAAPVKKGQEVGKAIISVPGQPDTTVTLVAANDVQPLGFMGKLRRKLSHLIGG